MKNKKNQDYQLKQLVLITVAIELITKVIDLIVAIIKLVAGNQPVTNLIITFYFSFVNYVKNNFVSYSNCLISENY